MRWLRPILTLILPVALLLPTVGTAQPKRSEAPWHEEGWVGAFAVPRPSRPNQAAHLEAAGPIPAEARIRLYRVNEPLPFLRQLLSKSPDSAALEGSRGSRDPLDLLREALLWGGRRAFVTVHRTASRPLRDAAKQTERLGQARTPSTAPRDGAALPLEGRKELSFVTELVPRITEQISGKSSEEDDNGDATGDKGHLSRVELPGQPAGLYLVEILRGSDAAYVPWLVTDLALLAEQDGGRLRIQALGAADGALQANVQGQIYEAGQGKALSFDGEGRSESPASPGVRRVVLAQTGNNLALLAIEGQASAAPRQRLYAFTERPLYRPGQEVFFKAILRSVDRGENAVVKGVGELPYTVLDPEDTEVAKGRAKLLNAETGTFGGTLQLPGSGRLGLYRLVFQGPAGPAQAEFKVEQFVKPAFSVTVSAPQAKVGLGDPLPFTVEARYFYGAAVRGASADWFLYKVVPKKAGWVWDDEDSGPAPELMESGELKLDDQGRGTLPTFPAKEEGLWRMVVKVADSANQRNSGQAQVRAAAGDMVLLIQTDRSVAAPGKPFQATARALDLDGHELSNIAITLKACRIVAEKDSKAWWARPSALKPGAVLAEAPGPKAQLSLPEGGLFLVVAEARDGKGRLVSAQRLMTVAAEGTPLPAVADLRANADKPEYRVGDTARILVRLPSPRLTLHWSLEHENLGQRQHRAINGTTALVEIPITAEMQPNVWAVFEIVADGRRQMAEVPLRVPKVDRRLQVSVETDQARYQPGQPMKVAVQVKDHEGRPVAADLAVGVVDEAIYALSAELHPDAVRFFHPTRRHGVLRSGSTEWSFWDLLRRQRPVGSLKQTRRGEFKADDDDKIRQNFKDTAHWVPFLSAGNDGKASTQLVLPDNLTAWRATATAVTADTKVGVGRSSRPSAKPLQVSLTLPRTLSVGEESRIIAQVRNLSGQTLSGTLRLEIANGRLGAGSESSYTLNDQGEHRVAVPVFPDKTGTMTLTARVQGGALKDAERRSVTVLDPLVPASTSGYLFLEGSEQQLELPVPPKAKGEASLVLTPVGSLEQLAAPSLPYLIGYPYGCVEQTLSSFVPNLLVADLIKQGLMPPLDWKQVVDLDRNIRDGVFRVYGYQLPNGGWGWYSPKDFGAEANPHTTGYAIQSLAAMKRLGYGVDEQVYRRGREMAFTLFRSMARQADERAKGAKPERNQLSDPAGHAAFLLQALVQTGEPLTGLLDSSADKVLGGQWPGGHVLAMTTFAAATARHPKAAALVAKLEASALQKGGLAHWEGLREDWYAYASGDIVPTTFALRALCLAAPKSPLLPRAEAYLATQFRGQGWFSTWSTASAVEVLPLLAKVRKLDWNAAQLQAEIEGGPRWDFSQIERPGLRRWTRKDPRPGFYAMEEAKALKVKAKGRGVLIWTYGYQVPGSASPDPKGESSGALKLDLRRQIWRLRTPQQTGNPQKGWIRQPWTGALKLGEEAWMELRVGSDRPADYAVLEVPIPAGLTPLVKLEGFVLEGTAFSDEDGANRWGPKPRIEIHPDRVSIFFQRLSPWEQPIVRIHLRAALAGQYHLRPAKLSLMSNETQWTTCDGLDLKVEEGNR